MPGLIEYKNWPPVIGALVSSRLVPVTELQAVLGVEDAYNLLELLTVDATNARTVREYHEALRQRG